MVDLYTQLITDVNSSINPLESGDAVVAKVTHSDTTDSAKKAGNAVSAQSAKSAGNVNSVSIGKTVINKELPLVHEYTVKLGMVGIIDNILDPGVYIALFKKNAKNPHANITSAVGDLCGVLTVIENKSTYCRMAGREEGVGATLFYEPHMKSIKFYRYKSNYVGQLTGENSHGTICIYKIGTLKGEG